MTALTRTYRCPMCGYDQFRSGKVKSTVDVNIQWSCPRCQTVDNLTVMMEETSDPRDEEQA